MESQLAQVIESLNLQNDVLDVVRVEYLEAEGCRKHYEARMIAMAPGKSHAEKVTNAQATESWKNQALTIARLEASMEFNKLKYQVLEKEWQSTYLSLKLDGDTIKKNI